jgi:hypothetical protein
VWAESSGCKNERRPARAFPVLPCALPALRGFAPRRAAQSRTLSTGNARAAQPGATRAALHAHSAALRRESARGAAPRREGARRRAKRNDTGRNDRRRMDIVAKTRDEPMLLAWASSGGELRR